MPTILIIKSVRFCIYFNDHGKAHVHVIKDGCEAKIELESLECVAVNGFSKRDIFALTKVVAENRNLLLSAWEDYNG